MKHGGSDWSLEAQIEALRLRFELGGSDYPPSPPPAPPPPAPPVPPPRPAPPAPPYGSRTRPIWASGSSSRVISRQTRVQFPGPPEHPPSWLDGADPDGADTGTWKALGQDLMAKRVPYGIRLMAKRVPYGRTAKWHPFGYQGGFSFDQHICRQWPKGCHMALDDSQNGAIWQDCHMAPFWPSALPYGTLLATPHMYIYICIIYIYILYIYIYIYVSFAKDSYITSFPKLPFWLNFRKPCQEPGGGNGKNSIR